MKSVLATYNWSSEASDDEQLWCIAAHALPILRGNDPTVRFGVEANPIGSIFSPNPMHSLLVVNLHTNKEHFVLLSPLSTFLPSPQAASASEEPVPWDIWACDRSRLFGITSERRHDVYFYGQNIILGDQLMNFNQTTILRDLAKGLPNIVPSTQTTRTPGYRFRDYVTACPYRSTTVQIDVLEDIDILAEHALQAQDASFTAGDMVGS
jgi:hypothetical protein